MTLRVVAWGVFGAFCIFYAVLVGWMWRRGGWEMRDFEQRLLWSAGVVLALGWLATVTREAFLTVVFFVCALGKGYVMMRHIIAAIVLTKRNRAEGGSDMPRNS